MKCNCCGQEVFTNGVCCVENCSNEAEFEGWIERKDFSGNPVGSMFRGRVCREHKGVLIGYGGEQ